MVQYEIKNRDALQSPCLILRISACCLYVCFVTPYLTSVRYPAVLLVRRLVGMRVSRRPWRGDPGQHSQCSVSWEPADFRSAKSGHKAPAAKPQRPTERFHDSIASHLQSAEERLPWGNFSSCFPFARAEDRRFHSTLWLRICEISLHYFKGCCIVKIMHSKKHCNKMTS